MREIKRRIKSVNNTRQITKAMELVSSAKLRRARLKYDQIKPYFNTVKDTINEILKDADSIQSKYFVGSREIKKSCYIVVTADRGLCGGFNSSVIKEASNAIKEKESVSVITIGQRGRDFFRKRGFDLDGEYINILEGISYKDAQKISNLAVQLYDEELVDEVYLVYTNFKSAISQEPEVLKLLPFEPTLEKVEVEEEKQMFEFIAYNPSPEGLFNYLAPKYVESMVFGGLIQSAVSEQAARRIAMENATDNAEEMIDKLTLHYNRARQAAITQEISEIVAGADALK